MRARRWLPPLAWMAVIFWGSTEGFSSGVTGSWLLPLLSALLPWADPAQLDLLHVAFRKGAHVLEYAILAWLWVRALAPAPHRGAPRRPALGAFALSAGYAGLDELHQAVSSARTGSVLDVLWDTAGAAAALGLHRFGWLATVSFLTRALLWLAAAGGTLLLLLHLLTGTPAGWLWASAPLAWLALWAWRRRATRHL